FANGLLGWQQTGAPCPRDREPASRGRFHVPQERRDGSANVRAYSWGVCCPGCFSYGFLGQSQTGPTCSRQETPAAEARADRTLATCEPTSGRALLRTPCPPAPVSPDCAPPSSPGSSCSPRWR